MNSIFWSVNYYKQGLLCNFQHSIGGSKGGARDARPPGGPNSFIFMQFSAKMWKIIAILGVGAPPGENPGSATAQCILPKILCAASCYTSDGCSNIWENCLLLQCQVCLINMMMREYTLWWNFNIIAPFC